MEVIIIYAQPYLLRTDVFPIFLEESQQVIQLIFLLHFRVLLSSLRGSYFHQKYRRRKSLQSDSRLL